MDSNHRPSGFAYVTRLAGRSAAELHAQNLVGKDGFEPPSSQIEVVMTSRRTLYPTELHSHNGRYQHNKFNAR